MRFIFILLNLIITTKSISQVLPDSSVGNLRRDAMLYFLPVVTIAYSINTIELDSVLAEDRNWEPNSFKKIDNLKKTICGCYQDIFTLSAIGDAFASLNMADSATVYFNQALQKTLTEISAHPDSASLSLHKAGLLFKTGQTKEAISLIEKRIEINPGDSLAFDFLTVFYFQQGELAKIVALTEYTLNRTPGDHLATFYYYYIDLMQSIFSPDSDSIKKYWSIQDPYFNKLDDVYVRYPNSIYPELLQQHILLWACFTNYFSELVLEEKNDSFKMTTFASRDTVLLESLKAYFIGLQKRKGFENKFIIHKSLGTIYLMTNKYDSANFHYNKSLDHFSKLRMDPSRLSTEEIYVNLIAIPMINHDTLMASAILAKKIKAMPLRSPNPEDYILMAKFNAASGNWEEMKLNCDRALAINPRSEWAYIGYAVYFTAQKQYKEAINQLDSAFAINQDLPEVYNLYGILYLLDNQPDVSKLFFERVQQVIPTDEYSRKALDTYFAR